MDGYLIDIDGTILSGRVPIEGAKEFLGALSQAPKPFLLMTNAISSPVVISRRLAEAGINVSPSNIRNPISAINSYLRSGSLTSCLVIGSDAEIAQIEADTSSRDPQVVVLLDFEKENTDFHTLQRIVELFVSGIPVVAASGSRFYLKGDKRRIDTGSFVELVEGITGRPIAILGKPSREYFESAIRQLGCEPERVLVVGDDWMTDIVGGEKAGARTALVRSGKYQTGDEFKCHPTMVVDRLMDIVGCLT